jgi:uncharacterized protein (TIGR03437 family)
MSVVLLRFLLSGSLAPPAAPAEQEALHKSTGGWISGKRPKFISNPYKWNKWRFRKQLDEILFRPLLCGGSDRIRKLIPPAAGRWIVPVLNPADAFLRSSPGSWLTLLGDFAGLPTMDWSGAIGTDGALPESLSGLTADLSGKPCVIAYISPDRIDLLLPRNLIAGYPGPQTLSLRLAAALYTYNILILPSHPEFLMGVGNGDLYPAAATRNLIWITPSQPALPGQTITLYVTGLNIDQPGAPPYDVLLPNGMQVVLAGYGYQVLWVRPFSPGVVELTIQLPSGIPEGVLPIRVVYGGYMSTEPTVLPVGR